MTEAGLWFDSELSGWCLCEVRWLSLGFGTEVQNHGAWASGWSPDRQSFTGVLPFNF
jgi:hypothetical protein